MTTGLLSGLLACSVVLLPALTSADGLIKVKNMVLPSDYL